MTSPGSTGTTRRQNSNRHSGRVPRLRDQRRGARCEAKQRSCYSRFVDYESIVHHDYATDGQTINKAFYLEVLRRFRKSVHRNDRKNGGMATGPCTTTMRARAHTHTHASHLVRQFLAKQGTAQLQQPP